MSTPLNPAARSLHLFGLYLLGAGAALMAAPAVLLSPLAIPVPTDVWIRVAGLLALCLGATDVLAARSGAIALIRFSVWRRVLAAVALLVFVAAGLAPPALCLFALVDAGAAGWTAWALRGLGHAAPVAARAA